MTPGRPDDTRLDGIAPLPHLGIIRVQGEDAARFLHAQLTQDFALLGDEHARLAAFCNAKGRMLASFVGWRRDGEILLVTPRDVLAPALRRLSMFVLRAKARLSDASEEYTLRGLAGTAVATAAGEPLATPWMRMRREEADLVALYPADGVPRALWLAPADTRAPAAPALGPEAWAWGEVRSAVAWITAPVVEAFVPQMLNYESVGGVNFKKGCYPGQEVVARSQFRGTLKRRAWPAHAQAPLQAGQEIFHASDPDQPCGLVAQAAPAPGGGWDAIVSIQTTAADGGALAVGVADGPALRLSPLPYALLADV